MTLPDFLIAEGITAAAFARRARLSEGMISLLCNGEAWLSKKTAEKIIRATSGKVTPNDFLPQKPQRARSHAS